MPSPLPFETSLRVRFRDLDTLGHVNNAVFVSYAEVARVDFWSHVFGPIDVAAIDFFVARIEIDYRRPVQLGDTVTVGVGIEKLGTTSFTVRYLMRVGEDVVAEARTVQVFVDTATGTPKPVPAAFRERVGPYVL